MESNSFSNKSRSAPLTAALVPRMKLYSRKPECSNRKVVGLIY